MILRAAKRCLALLVIVLGLPASGQEASGNVLSALARLSGPGVEYSSGWTRQQLKITLTRAVPWRVFTLDAPRRLVLDFSEVDWSGFDAEGFAAGAEAFTTVRAGVFRPGWSRIVFELNAPFKVEEAGMVAMADGNVQVALSLQKTDADSFAATTGAPAQALFTIANADTPPLPAHTRQTGDRPLVVVLDPGHGGIDPGAERAGMREADLVLQFARELKEELLRGGNFEVTLTRDSDVFIPLETRVTLARQAGADVFISIHADVLSAGRASGASVYTLSDEASDLASEKLAERHDRGDLLAGVDLNRQSDSVALVLMDMARRETQPRADRLADALVEGIYAATSSARKNMRLSAGFSVLKAPDIPSVLIELGFLSSERDRANLADPAWRRSAAQGIRDALSYWAIEDAADAVRLRQ